MPRTIAIHNCTSSECLVLTVRWGGGAAPGCYHVFMATAGTMSLRGAQCVVDDFGGLVPVGV